MPVENPFEPQSQADQRKTNVVVIRWICASAFVGALMGSTLLTPQFEINIIWLFTVSGVIGAVGGIALATILLITINIPQQEKPRIKAHRNHSVFVDSLACILSADDFLSIAR